LKTTVVCVAWKSCQFEEHTDTKCCNKQQRKKEIADRRSNWRRMKKQQQTWVTEEKAKEESTQKSCWLYSVAAASGSRFL
jgi:hypothetical protein